MHAKIACPVVHSLHIGTGNDDKICSAHLTALTVGRTYSSRRRTTCASCTRSLQSTATQCSGSPTPLRPFSQTTGGAHVLVLYMIPSSLASLPWTTHAAPCTWTYCSVPRSDLSALTMLFLSLHTSAVGNSGSLKFAEFGDVINTHDLVLRSNQVPPPPPPQHAPPPLCGMMLYPFPLLSLR